MRIRTVSSSIANAETSDAMLKCNCAANAIGVTLSVSKSYPGEVNIKKVDSSANAVTITPASGETIDGSASITLTIENEKKTLIPVDGGWTEVDNINDLPTAAVDLTSAQTLTNKTLTTPVVASFYQDAGLTKLMTVPDTASDTLTTIAATQTLTNKTLTSPNVNEAVALARTATQLNLITQGVAAGYKIARGTTTPTTASDTVATGLATVVAVIVSFKGAPSLTHMFNYGDIGNQAGTPAAGSFLLKSSKPTGVADVTPIASTTPWSAVDWIAIGT